MKNDLKLLDLEARKQIVQAARRLYLRNLLAACDGNISIRLSNEHILMTPTGVSKSDLHEEQIAVINLEGQVLKGSPSGERLMHLEVYRSCPNASAVVHAHPPHAIAWSVAAPALTELPANSLSEVILAAGSIPIAKYARPGSKAMGDVLKGYLPSHRAMILSRHGAICWGESLEEAVNGMERIEHSAQILAIAQQLGGLSELPAEEIAVLKSMRKEIGEKLL